MARQIGQQITTTLALSSFSRSKGNQTIRFGQLIEYNMRNYFLGKSYKKCSGEASPRRFYKKFKIEHIYRSSVWNVIVYPSNGLPKYIKITVLTTCFYLISTTLKNKIRPVPNLPASFSAWFLKKNISHFIFY